MYDIGVKSNLWSIYLVHSFFVAGTGNMRLILVDTGNTALKICKALVQEQEHTTKNYVSASMQETLKSLKQKI